MRALKAFVSTDFCKFDELSAPEGQLRNEFIPGGGVAIVISVRIRAQLADLENQFDGLVPGGRD